MSSWVPIWVPGQAGLATARYALWQLGASGALVLPRWVPTAEAFQANRARHDDDDPPWSEGPSGERGGKCGEDDAGLAAQWGHQSRTTKSLFRTLGEEQTAALVRACRAQGATVSRALCAAAALGASDAMGSSDDQEYSGQGGGAKERYKVLQALDMRRQRQAVTGGEEEDWSRGTVVAGTGSLDLLLDLPPRAGEACRYNRPASTSSGSEGGAGMLRLFWPAARSCTAQTKEWLAAGWARESLLLFAAGWEFMNMNRVVELGSQDEATLGRAYSAGVSNVGVFRHPTRYPCGGGSGDDHSGGGGEGGALEVERVHFGISQSVSAPAVSVSAATVGGRLCLTVQYAAPIWPAAEAEAFADHLVETLELAAAAAPEDAPAAAGK